jgi:DNA-binding MarR family transcriptional regulator
MSKPPPLTFATTIEVRDSCICLHVQRAARALARAYDEALRPVGLTNGQFSLMMALNRPSPPTIGDVAAVLAMDRTTVTASLKPLQRRKLVEVGIDPEDRRGRRMTLTGEGRSLLQAALPLWLEEQARTTRRLGGRDAERLLRDLLSLSSGADVADGPRRKGAETSAGGAG